MRRLALISNPDSGSAGEGDAEGALEAAGWELVRFSIEDAADAAEAGVERIVVAGGDGSIAPAAAAASSSGVPLAVIPAGTANDFADRIGLPGEIAGATELAAGGERTRRVDLAEVGGRPFVNAASLGLAPVAAEAAEELKESLGALAYSVGALQAAGSETPFECRVSADGEELYAGPAWQLTVGCTGAFGGGSRIEADADDGKLDWVVIEGGPRARLAKHALGMRTGRVESQKGVETGRHAELDVTASDCEQLNVDGEIVATDALEGDRGQIRFAISGPAFELVIG
jgi:YegS/Rv2252/BmrU family lipid kinase